MSKPIEMGMFISDWGIKAVRVGQDAFVALLSNERMGTNPVVVIREKRGVRFPNDLNTPDVENKCGVWTRLRNPGYMLAEESPVTIYGGEGSFELTPHRILTASTEEITDINRALSEILTRAIEFAEITTNSA